MAIMGISRLYTVANMSISRLYTVAITSISSLYTVAITSISRILTVAIMSNWVVHESTWVVQRVRYYMSGAWEYVSSDGQAAGGATIV